MAMAEFSRADFNHSPYLVFYEVTRACDLKCQHCRASAQSRPHPGQLSTSQSKTLLEELAGFPKKPLLVFTGGDPMKRPDLEELIRHADAQGLTVALTPSATDLVTREALERVRDAGVQRLALSLDGADAATHDYFRGFSGAFERTMELIDLARQVGLPLQVNTTVTRHNAAQLESIAQMLSGMQIALWSVFFLVPVGRAYRSEPLGAQEVESLFERLWTLAQTMPYTIKTTEAPHYRRFALQKQKQRGGIAFRPGPGFRAPLGTNDGRGVMFISHIGQIYPSGFLPMLAGKFPEDSVVKVYQESPVFQALRDSSQLKGKCGYCEFKEICGGSRARAYAVSGDALAEEPHCSYQPVEPGRPALS